MTKFVFSLLTILFWSGTLAWGADDLVVDFWEGTVEVRVGQQPWKPVETGQSLPREAQLRLHNGLVELVSGDRRLHLAKNGTFQLAPLLQDAPRPSSLADQAVAKLNKLLGKVSGTPVAQAGVRGDAQNDTATEWVDGEDAVDDAHSWAAVLVFTLAGLEAGEFQPVLDRIQEALPRTSDPELIQLLTEAQEEALRGLGMSPPSP